MTKPKFEQRKPKFELKKPLKTPFYKKKNTVTKPKFEQRKPKPFYKKKYNGQAKI